MRTTYFPAGKFDHIATGFAARKVPHALGEKHIFPLIGGSLYSTAEEMMKFAQGVGGFIDTADGTKFLTRDSSEQLQVNWNPGEGYLLGWGGLSGETMK